MLFRIGLVTPRAPSSNDGSDLDIQYGVGLVHFYPNLGGDAPSSWQIPYLFPPPTRASVSNQVEMGTDVLIKESTQVGTGSAITRGFPHSNNSSISIESVYSSDGSGETMDKDEGHLSCPGCVSHHDDPCPNLISQPVPPPGSLNGASTEAVHHTGDSTKSLPLLEYLTDVSSDLEGSVMEDEGESRPSEWRRGWDQFKAEISEELSREQDERIAEWSAYQEEKQVNREKEREEETRRNLEDEPIRKRTKAHIVDLPSPSPDARPMSTPDLSRPPSPSEVLMLPPRPLNPHLTDEERRVKEILESRYHEDQSVETFSPGDQLVIERVRRGSVADLSTKIGKINLEDPKTILAQNQLKKSLLFAPPSVQVYSVHVPAPSFHRNYVRPPTPFPDPELLTPPESVYQPVGTNGGALGE